MSVIITHDNGVFGDTKLRALSGYSLNSDNTFRTAVHSIFVPYDNLMSQLGEPKPKVLIASDTGILSILLYGPIPLSIADQYGAQAAFAITRIGYNPIKFETLIGNAREIRIKSINGRDSGIFDTNNIGTIVTAQYDFLTSNPSETFLSEKIQ